MLQLPEVRPSCQVMQVGNPDLQILFMKTSLPPMQGQQTTDTQMCKLRTGARHYKSPLPKENGSREESKDRTSVTTNHTQTGQQETSSHTIVKRMGHIDRTGSGEAVLFMQTMNSHNHTHNNRANNGSKYKTIKANSKELNTKNNAEQKVRTSKGGTRPTTNHQCMDKAVRTINEGISCSYVSEPVPFRQTIPTNQQVTNTTPIIRGRSNRRCTRNNTHCTQRCNISTQEDFYREHSSSTCTQENNGGSHGRYQHTQRIYDIFLPTNGAYQAHTHSSGRGGKVVSKTGHSEGHPKCSDMREGDGLVLNNDLYQGNTPSTSGRSTTTNGTHRAATHIKLVHWNEQLQRPLQSRQPSYIDIVMIQDTRYNCRLDDLPNLRIHGYHTYHRTMDEGGHGMVTMIKHTIPSEEAEQIHLGDGRLYQPRSGLTTNHYYYTIYTEWMKNWI